MTERTSLGTCGVGSATDTPCRRAAVWSEEGLRFCERHLMVVEFREAIEEAQIILDRHLKSIQTWANER